MEQEGLMKPRGGLFKGFLFLMVILVIGGAAWLTIYLMNPSSPTTLEEGCEKEGTCVTPVFADVQVQICGHSVAYPKETVKNLPDEDQKPMEVADVAKLIGHSFDGTCFGEVCNGDTCKGEQGEFRLYVNGDEIPSLDEYTLQERDVVTLSFQPRTQETPPSTANRSYTGPYLLYEGSIKPLSLLSSTTASRALKVEDSSLSIRLEGSKEAEVDVPVGGGIFAGDAEKNSFYTTSAGFKADQMEAVPSEEDIEEESSEDAEVSDVVETSLLEGTEYFSTMDYSTMNLEVTSITPNPDDYDVEANLTMRGTTQRINFKALIISDEQSTKLTATIAVDPALWGMTAEEGDQLLLDVSLLYQ